MLPGGFRGWAAGFCKDFDFRVRDEQLDGSVVLLCSVCSSFQQSFVLTLILKVLSHVSACA